jgi:hypothetical protein
MSSWRSDQSVKHRKTLHLPSSLVFAQCVLEGVVEISDTNFSPVSERPNSRINNTFKIQNGKTVLPKIIKRQNNSKLHIRVYIISTYSEIFPGQFCPQTTVHAL